MRPIAALSLLLLLAACANPLQKLKSINPSADNFPDALASEYLAYAESESEQGRSLVAEHYAHKGLEALQGKNVAPEEPDASLPEADRQALAAARARLESFLTEDMKRVAPQKLARAQLLFDCWQHELARDISQRTAPCADEFASVIGELQEVADSFRFNEQHRYRLHFSGHSARLSAQDRVAIRAMGRQVSKASDYRVILTSHAGLSTRKQALMEQRLAAVRKALEKAGMDEARMRVGELPEEENSVLPVHLSCDVEKEDDKGIIVTLKLHTHIQE